MAHVTDTPETIARALAEVAETSTLAEWDGLTATEWTDDTVLLRFENGAVYQATVQLVEAPRSPR